MHLACWHCLQWSYHRHNSRSVHDPKLCPRLHWDITSYAKLYWDMHQCDDVYEWWHVLR